MPPRVVSLVFSSDPERGFLVANAVIVGFGVWCSVWPVRRNWRIAPLLLVLAVRLAVLLRRR